MKTVAARSEQLYRHHALQIVITYHAGMQAIGYNWGSFNYYHGVYASPDDNSMRRGATVALRRHRQRREATQLPVRPDVVVGVPGARRDGGLGVRVVGQGLRQAYAVDPEYSKARTTYTSGQVPPRNSCRAIPRNFCTPPRLCSQVRALTVLVETSDAKPPTSTLGSTSECTALAAAAAATCLAACASLSR